MALSLVYFVVVDVAVGDHFVTLRVGETSERLAAEYLVQLCRSMGATRVTIGEQRSPNSGSRYVTLAMAFRKFYYCRQMPQIDFAQVPVQSGQELSVDLTRTHYVTN